MIARREAIAGAIVLASAAAHVWVHARAGLSLPAPWPDEAHFLWPARSLVEHGTLAAPELHPDRALRWMPPGYAAVMAAVFSVTGPSLLVARNMSTLCVLAAAGMLALLPRSRIVGAIVAAWWLLAPSVIAIGNVARMEALVLALVLAGFVALGRDRAPLGIGAIAAAIAVHPHALVFAVAAAAWMMLARARVRPRNAIEGTVLVVGIVAMSVAWIVTAAGEGFADDLRFQLARKADRDLLGPWLDRRTLVAAFVAATPILARGRRERGLLVAAALAALVVRNVGREMWYAAFDPLFYALATAALLDAARELRRGWLPSLAVAAAIAVAAWPERPALHWRGMAVRDDPYLAYGTRDRVVEALHGAGAVEVLPRGDAALFLDHPGLRFVDPVRHPFAPDATLLHVTDHQPRHVQSEVHERLAAAPHAEPLGDGWWLIR